MDGVFTDGKFHYTADGKVMKTFGDADNDALSLIKSYIHIEMVTGDKRGFSISERRIRKDMGYKISLVSTFDRLKWIAQHFNLDETIYMGDGIFDSLVFAKVGYSIAPANAFHETKRLADFVTKSKGGEGAVAEACFHILEKFANKTCSEILQAPILGSGSWSAN